MKNQPGAIRCPDPSHTAPMVRRTNRSTGEEFYGCAEYPSCLESRPIPQSELLRAMGAAELPLFDE